MSESTGEKKTGLGVIFLTVFMDLVGFSMIFPLFPALLEYYLKLEGETGLLGGILSVVHQATSASGAKADVYTAVLFGGILGSLYAVLQFFCAPFWGQLSDRLGRRRILVITVGGTALSYVIWFFSGSFTLLILSRFVGGMMSGNISVASAAIADVTTAENRSKGMGMLGAAFGLGFILGPAIGGGLSKIDLMSVMGGVPGVNPFSAPALGAFILAAINFVWVLRRFNETLDPEHQSDAAHARRPYNPLAAMAKVDVAGVNQVNLVYFIYTFAFTGMEFTLTFLARDRFDYTPAKNALLFVFVGFIIAFVQGGLVRRLAPRLGEKRVTLGGLLLILPGLYVLGQATSEGAMYAGLGLLSFGSALATPTLTSLVSLYTPPKRQGEILGIFRSLGSLARAIGPLIASFAYWKYGSEWPYFGAAAIMIIPIALGFALPKPSLDDAKA